MHALLLIEIVDDGPVFSGEKLEAIFAPGIGQAAAIENESASITGFIFGQAAMKRKTEDSHDQVVRLGSQALQFLRSQHAVEGAHQRR